MQELSIDELNRIYSEGETADGDVFSEQRSNVLLSAGEHYAKKYSKWWNRIREAKELSQDQRLRLTQNHTYKIVRGYINNILSQAPGVTPSPNNPKEIQDQKTAELNKAVWEYAKVQHHLRTDVIPSWCKDFVEIGEVGVDIYWDPLAGRFLGYEQKMDENGCPCVDETGAPEPSETAVFTGDLVFEKVYGFNLIRPAEAKTIKSAKWLCIRKMIGIKDLQALVGDDEEKKKLVQSSRDETFFVFDSGKKASYKAENEVMLRKFVFRPCVDYPNGYYYITVEKAILFKGELPYGVFPIVYEGFDEIATTPRHRSIIKQIRPFQAELNRTASKMAEHQITLGDDKVVMLNGSKMTQGPHLPGIRALYVTGQSPTILEGRTGAQYFEYYNAKVEELYRVCNYVEDSEKDPAADPYANLYKNLRQKKAYGIYATKFGNFLSNVCLTYLELAKNYFDENMLIPAIGRAEYVNIPEFKTQDKLCYRIKIEEISDDIETMMGRHLVLNHILQFGGQNLDKDDIGKIIRQMPFVNTEEILSDFTINYDTATNIILALDRGEMPNPNKSNDGAYILKRLAARQAQADYGLLNPQIQNNYDQLIQIYEQGEAQKAQDLKAMESQFIPTGGAMIKVDYYVPDPTNPARSVRATLPAEAVDDLINKLAKQGSSQQQLQQQTPNVQADIARMLQQQQGQVTPGGINNPQQQMRLVP